MIRLSIIQIFPVNLKLLQQYLFFFFVRVRPLSNKEIKSGDEMVVQFPGDGQIYVSTTIILKIISNYLEKSIRLLKSIYRTERNPFFYTFF